MMTKKHYVAIARCLNALVSGSEAAPGHNISAGYRQALFDTAHVLSFEFEHENLRFDRARFLTACGLEG